MFCSTAQNQLNERLLQQDLVSRTVVSYLATMPEGNLPVFVLDVDVEYELSNKSQIELTPRIVVSHHEGQATIALLVLEMNDKALSTMTVDSGGMSLNAYFNCMNPLVGFCIDLTDTATPVVPYLIGRSTSTQSYKILLCEDAAERNEFSVSMAASWAECLTLAMPTAEEWTKSNKLGLNTQL